MSSHIAFLVWATIQKTQSAIEYEKSPEKVVASENLFLVNLLRFFFSLFFPSIFCKLSDYLFKYHVIFK